MNVITERWSCLLPLALGLGTFPARTAAEATELARRMNLDAARTQAERDRQHAAKRSALAAAVPGRSVRRATTLNAETIYERRVQEAARARAARERGEPVPSAASARPRTMAAIASNYYTASGQKGVSR